MSFLMLCFSKRGLPVLFWNARKIRGLLISLHNRLKKVYYTNALSTCMLTILQTRQLLLMVQDELHDMQPKFNETLCDEVLLSFKEDLKSIAQSKSCTRVKCRPSIFHHF